MHASKLSIIFAIFAVLAMGWLREDEAQTNEHGKRESRLAELANAERAFAATTVKEGFRDGFIKFFADDGIGFGPHPQRTREELSKSPPATGPRKVIFNWAPIFGDISADGDLGYTTGPVLYTDMSANPRPPRHGMYFSVWQKQPDGSWKVAIDMGIDTPLAVFPLDTPFTAAEPVKRSGKANGGGSDYRKLDSDLSGSIAKTSPEKAYRGRLDTHFRIHRRGMMPIIEPAGLTKITNTAAKFEFIDGKIASSHDLAFTYGKYVSTDAGKLDESGYYVHVWRVDPAGKWRLVADIQNPLPKTEN